MTTISNTTAPSALVAQKAAANARAADGDYKTSGAGHRVKDADGDYKQASSASASAASTTASSTLDALASLTKGG